MNVSNSRIFVLVLAGCAIALANCGGGNVAIPAGHPGASPTAVTSPTAHPSGSATATASATASAKPTTTPTAAPTTTPTGGPTPTATPTTAACAAPPPDPNATQVQIVGGPQPQTINVPCFKDFTSVATIPANTQVQGVEYAVIKVTTDDLAFKIPDDPAAGTRILTTGISVTPTFVVLGNADIPTTVTSPSMINQGHTYEAELYLDLGQGPVAQPQKYWQLGLIPNAQHTISFNVINPAGTFFPSGPIAYVVLYQNP